MADINILTAAMKVQFLNSMQAVGKPAPIEAIVTEVPSTARIENYAWMTPAPGISRYKGYRRLAKMSSIKYTVENLEYDGSFTVPLRDVEDDQVGGYKRRMKDLVEKSKAPFRTRLLLQFLNNGASNTCFDGSNFFNTTHNIGGYPTTNAVLTGGGNKYTVNAAASADATTHNVYLLVRNEMLCPLIYQNRKPPKFGTDAGTPASEKAKKADYWIDLEAAAAHGYWWDAIKLTITGTPTILELITYLDNMHQQMSQFSLPVSLATDPLEYVHEQLVWSPETITVATSIGLQTLMNRVLNESYYGISVAGSTSGVTPNNLYFKKFTHIASNYLNP